MRMVTVGRDLRATSELSTEPLVDVVRDLAATRTLDEIIGIVRRAARALTGADGATFVLRDGDLCHYVDEDAIAPLWKGKRFPMATCISGWAMLNRTPAVIDDIYADDRIPHDAYRPTFVRSLVMVPIRTTDPVGAIGNYWASLRRPTAGEVRVLQALADSTAVAMESVRLYAELEARVELRTAELAAANDDLRQFTAAVAHDVRSPLAAIQGFADLLATEYADDLTPRTLAAAAAIQRSANHLSDFMTDLLDYARSGTRAITVEDVAFDDLVRAVLERLGHDIAERRAHVEVDGAGSIRGDRVLLGQVLQNLVGNAVAYVPDGREPRVRISFTHDGAWDELVVTDNGDGVPVGEREAIFAPFQRGKSAVGRRGSGLGLALCARVAECHGGTIHVREAADGGAAFVLRIPRDPR